MGKLSHRWGLLSFAIFAFSTQSTLAGGVYDSLSEAQKKTIHEGRQVIVYEDQGEIWPRIKVYQGVDAPMKEVAAVLADYDRYGGVVHRVKQARTTRTSDPAVSFIDYELDVPVVARPFFSSHYQIRNKLEYLGPNVGYRMKWQLSQSKDIARLDGGAMIEPIADGKATLVYYTNLLVPKSNNMILRSDLVISSVKRSYKVLETLVGQVYAERRSMPVLLSAQMKELERIFPDGAATMNNWEREAADVEAVELGF